MPLLLVAAAVIFLLILIMAFRLNAFLALIIVAIGLGLAEGMALKATLSSVQNGMGGMLGSLVMILGFGAMLGKLLVDSGSEFTWVQTDTLKKAGITREKKDYTFVMANGQKITRSVGFAIIRYDKFFTVDEVVFAEKGDLLLLGARTLEGLNLMVDSSRKKLVAAGPLPAA